MVISKLMILGRMSLVEVQATAGLNNGLCLCPSHDMPCLMPMFMDYVYAYGQEKKTMLMLMVQDYALWDWDTCGLV